MDTRHVKLIHIPTMAFLILTAILSWIDPYYLGEGLQEAYWIVFSCAFIFYGMYLMSRGFLDNYDYVFDFKSALFGCIPGAVMAYFGFHLYFDGRTFIVYILFAIALIFGINYIINYFMSIKLSWSGFATLLCILICLACFIFSLWWQIDYLLFTRLSYSVLPVGVFLKFLAELKEAR